MIIAHDIEDTVTPASAAGRGRLPHIGVLRFSGPDAIGFLQGQVSNDTLPLSRGAPVLAAYSTPQGRVLAIVHLLPHSSGILGLLPRDVAASTQDRLRKFVLRAKVKIEDVSEHIGVVGMDGNALAAAAVGDAPGATGYVEKDGIGIGRVRDSAAASARYWVVGDAASIAGVASAGEPGRIERDWRLGDIRDGLPQVYAATSESFVAQMLNLDLIGGISFSKGCYTGQEIIARTQHLGRIKRRLSRLRLPSGTWSIGQPLRLADGRSGRLTEIVPVGGGFEALAVLSLDAGAADADTASEEAIPAEELPLPYPTR
jgi:folate-binding protein YgfZ